MKKIDIGQAIAILANAVVWKMGRLDSSRCRWSGKDVPAAMRAVLVLFVAGALPGCAGRAVYYQTGIVSAAYEPGTVISVQLVAPGNFVYYDCYAGDSDYYWTGVPYGDCKRTPKISPRIRDAVPSRGPDGVIDMTDSSRLLSSSADASELLDGTIPVEAARARGWRIHNTIRLDSDREITVVDTRDKGLVIGDPVTVVFPRSQFEIFPDGVNLHGPGEEIPDPVADDPALTIPPTEQGN